MGMSDYKLWLHGKATPTVGVDIGHAADEYSEDEVDFGVTNPNVGAGGKCGLHFVINESFNANLTSAQVWIVHGAATAPTTLLIGRYFLLAELVKGKHYFIPMPPTNLQFVRAYFDLTGVPTAGQVCMWLGPDEDGTG
jgi:hypothetical protein